MGSQWTNKYAILRDLSVAQGRKVPAEIIGSVGVGQKPAVFKIKEDNEEEFFQNFVGDGNLYTKPDLSLIKEMLNMVQESDTVDDGDVDKMVEISKLNPLSKSFQPKVLAVGDKNKKVIDKVDYHARDDANIVVAEVNNVDTKQKLKTAKKRKERNVAILSLLEKEKLSLAEPQTREKDVFTPSKEISEIKSEAVIKIQNSEKKLLKPNDFIIDNNMTESVEKVKEWLQQPVKPPLEMTKPITISPVNMFQKKKPVILNSESTRMFKKKSDASSIRSSDSDTVLRQSDNVFVPSAHANEYYKKFLVRHLVQEKAQEDIWKRAERLMKEIDARRLKENEQSNSVSNPELCVTLEENVEAAKTEAGPSLPLNIPGLGVTGVREAVVLPQHRHNLPEECKVCLAVAKHRRGTAALP